MLCPPSAVHLANCLRTLAGENTHHPDSVDLPPPSAVHFANCLRTLAGENTHHPDTVSICSHLLSPLHVQFPHAYEWPPYRCATQSLRKTFTKKLQSYSVHETQCRSAHPLLQPTSRTVSGHWLERTRTIQTQ